jgi:23S rRNA (adenine2503-C2)-methyltransferase
MDLELLETALSDAGEPAYRARQVWEWTARGATGYDVMTNLPRALRECLAAEVPFSTLTVQREARSRDGTIKTLFHTADGRSIEAVLMRYRDGRRSVCLSSQSGCPLTCTFCATGAMRFGRNLLAAEILDQALHFRRVEAIDHVVFMGMGEPMMNLDAVLAACRALPDVGVTHRHTAISTVGWIPGIERLTDEGMPLRLALSLHAADDALRTRLMPVNERYPLADVLAACRAYFEATRRTVFIEYVMLAGVNDRHEQARAGRRARPTRLQGQPHPLQPHGYLRRLRPGGDRRLQGGAGGPRPARDRAPHARRGHRRRLRPARGRRRGR